MCFSLKVGLLKWRPDYDVAADEYTKAGTYLVYLMCDIHIDISLWVVY